MGDSYETGPVDRDSRTQNGVEEEQSLEEEFAERALGLFWDSGITGGEECGDSDQNSSIAPKETILALYNEYRPRLYRYMRSLNLGRDEADEVIQETFMRLTAELGGPREIQNIRGWIVRVAHNLAVRLRRSQRLPLLAESPQVLFENRVDPALNPEQVYSRKERIRRMKVALAQLKPEHRQCFQMRVQGFRYKDIGLALSISQQRAAFLVKQVAVYLASICG